MTDNALQQLIVERIQREGPISFAEYMRMALYEPGYGYYVTGSAKMGWEGDYYTSTDVSTFFAHCMGRQLEQMWQKLRYPSKFVVVEQGAGRGHLEQEIRFWAEQEAPEFYRALEYQTEDIRFGQDAITSVVVNEGSGMPLVTEEQGIRRGGSGAVLGEDPWVALGGDRRPTLSRSQQGGEASLPTPPLSTPAPTGTTIVNRLDNAPSVFLSNELVDAFPVHIVEVRDRRLHEVYVDEREGRLGEVLGEPSSDEVANYLDNFKIPWRTFGNGWRAEINLDALRWMERTAKLLRKGFILTIDYGEKARALYTDFRRRGTLTCYFHHHMNERPLVRPGEQDITAYVNFSALIAEGRQHGLRLSKYTTQRLWLEEMGISEELEQIKRRDFAAADTERATDRGQIALFQWYNLRQRVAALTEPAGMGNFKVLILRR